MVDSGQGFAQLWRTNLKLKEGETINIGTNHDNVYEQNQKHIPGLYASGKINHILIN